jgi:hypothetical protein
MKTVTPARSAVRISACVLAILAIPLIGKAISNDVDWSVADFVAAGILLGIVGICIDIAVQRRGNLAIAGAASVLGAIAAVAGELDDSPGLTLIGGLMIASGGAVAHRHTRSTR